MATPYNHGFDFLPEAQSGGLRTHPVCGVLSGLDVSLTKDKGNFPTNKTVTITVSPGRARFEGVEVSLPSQVTPTITLPTAMTLNSVNKWSVYLNAPRKAPITTGVPTGGNDGDRALHVAAISGGYRVIARYERVSGTWTKLSATTMPIGKGYGALPFNEYTTTLTTAHFSGIPEADVYEAEVGVPYVSFPSPPLARKGTFILLANVTVSVPSSVTWGNTDMTAVSVDNSVKLKLAL